MRLDEEINLSELSGYMGIARGYSASAVDSLAPITVIATLLLSVLETKYLSLASPTWKVAILKVRGSSNICRVKTWTN